MAEKICPLKARVLDIGCGNGNFLEYLSSIDNYFELHGIERDTVAAARAMSKQGMTIKTSPLMCGDYPNDYFDAVTMFHVFEHLDDPREILSVIDSILKPGGILYLSFQYLSVFQARMFKGKWLHLDPPRHLFFFAPKDFIALMSERNFACKQMSYVSLEQNPFGMIQSLLNMLLKKREVLFERLKGNANYARNTVNLVSLCRKFFLWQVSPFSLYMTLQ